MALIVGLIATAALFAAPAVFALDREQTKALVRVAVKLSGLSERAPVRIVVERPARFRRHRVALLGRGYPRTLQDQHFRLNRIARLRGGDDAKIAARAAVEGYATLVTRVVSHPQPASLSGPKLRRFLELRRDFVDSVGLRFASDLRNLGDAKAAIDSQRRFPATSEQV